VAQNSDSISINKKPTLFFRDSLNFMRKIDVLAPDFYRKNLPFFCDKELKVQKMTKIPVKIRLGSVDYVNKLEGKHL
jgi:hypothetical protein